MPEVPRFIQPIAEELRGGFMEPTAPQREQRDSAELYSVAETGLEGVASGEGQTGYEERLLNQRMLGS